MIVLSIMDLNDKKVSYYFFNSDEKIKIDLYYKILFYPGLRKFTKTTITCGNKMGNLPRIRPRISVKTFISIEWVVYPKQDIKKAFGSLISRINVCVRENI